MGKWFGTDGIRGVANVSPLTPDTLTHIAQAVGQEIALGDHRHMVVIGKDTRLSGYLIEFALTAGFTSIGMDVMLVGPLPTPAISMLTRSLRADLGVMISASHNAYQDNGLKFFGADGMKFSDAREHSIENTIQTINDACLVSPEKLGSVRRLDDAQGRYIEYVKNTFPKGKRLDGLRVVVDCANGAAYKIAPKILWELGAEVIPLAVEPNGRNINDTCGATQPALMQQAVRDHKADLGIALDGDADRVIMADDTGALIDGDQLLAAIAIHWQKTHQLKGGVVGTAMANLGLEKFLGTQGIDFYRSRVGDRYVKATMLKKGCNLGGESSGHIILSDYIGTGDGLVGALQFLAIMLTEKKPARAFSHLYTPVPQLQKNIHVKNPDAILENPNFLSIKETIEKKLGTTGRIIVRKSGTEPVIRLMVEAEDAQLAKTCLLDIEKACT